MNYVNFDDAITAKYGIVIEKWPLKEFRTPSKIGSKVEVEVLYYSWENGKMQFRRLSNAEFAQWKDRYIQEKMHVVNSVDNAAESNDLSALAIIPLGRVINAVSAADGSAIVLPKTARKGRKDKGQPRKKKTNELQHVVPFLNDAPSHVIPPSNGILPHMMPPSNDAPSHVVPSSNETPSHAISPSNGILPHVMPPSNNKPQPFITLSNNIPIDPVLLNLSALS